MGLEEKLPDGIFTAKLEDVVNWSRKNSTWPLLFGLACCAIEMIAAGTARHDIARYGSELFRASPRQADLMIVSGRVSNKMAPVVKRLYDQMLEPKWVIAMGICASAGGPFNNYAIIQGVDKIIPVDVYVPGCPPRPEGLLYAMDKLREKQGRETFAMRKRDNLATAMLEPEDIDALSPISSRGN
jgi:NADH-quinone oxidoreductase subunit B